MNNQTELDLSTRVSAKSGLVTAPMNEDLVMLDLEQGMYFALDDVGSVIWSLIEQPVRVADLCRELVQLYAVNDTTCTNDTLAFLEELRAMGLLRVHE